jgi:hypothetical protein
MRLEVVLVMKRVGLSGVVGLLDSHELVITFWSRGLEDSIRLTFRIIQSDIIALMYATLRNRIHYTEGFSWRVAFNVGITN